VKSEIIEFRIYKAGVTVVRTVHSSAVGSYDLAKKYYNVTPASRGRWYDIMHRLAERRYCAIDEDQHGFTVLVGDYG